VEKKRCFGGRRQLGFIPDFEVQKKEGPLGKKKGFLEGKKEKGSGREKKKKTGFSSEERGEGRPLPNNLKEPFFRKEKEGGV